MVLWIIPIVRQSKTDLIHRQVMRPLRHGGSHFVNPCMCVLSTLCGNVNKHSPFDIYIYIYAYLHVIYIDEGNIYTYMHVIFDFDEGNKVFYI